MTTGVTIPRMRLTGRNRTAVRATMRKMIGNGAKAPATTSIRGKMMTAKTPAPSRIRPRVVREGKRSAVSPPK